MRALEKSELMKKKSVFEIFVANIIKGENICVEEI